MPGRAEIIGRYSGDFQGHQVLIELEKLRIGPYIGAVMRDIDRHVAHEADAEFLAKTLPRLPGDSHRSESSGKRKPIGESPGIRLGEELQVARSAPSDSGQVPKREVVGEKCSPGVMPFRAAGKQS